MSLKKDTQGAQEDPSGVKVIQAREGGPKAVTCPKHKLAASPQSDGKGGTVFVCPRGCRLGSSRM